MRPVPTRGAPLHAEARRERQGGHAARPAGGAIMREGPAGGAITREGATSAPEGVRRLRSVPRVHLPTFGTVQARLHLVISVVIKGVPKYVFRENATSGGAWSTALY